MSATNLCECGRALGAREVYCAACGRKVPGRVFDADPGTDAAPPGWLVAADARGESGWFEPLPAVQLSVPDWQERARPRRGEAATPESPQVAVPPPVAVPPRSGLAAAAGAGVAAPPLHALQAPLLGLVMLSTIGAVLLLVLHVLLGR